MTQSHVAPESTAQAEAPRGDVTVQPGEVATTVAELPDQLRREIVAARENGATLAELKRDFGRQVAADVIREVLPPGNARERRAREARQSKADQPKPELSKRAQDAVADAKAKPQAAPRYVTDEQVIEELASGITACRERGVGRARLAELAGTIPMVPYRAEVLRRVQPDEVEPLRTVIAKVAADPTLGRKSSGGSRGATKADLEARVDAVVTALRTAVASPDVKTRTHWLTVVNEALLVLDPPAAS